MPYFKMKIGVILMQRATIKDIARELDVSVGTVYRALNNTGRIKAETKERVLQKAQELHYQPNTVARKFAMKNKFRILVVMPEDPAYYWDDVQRGLSLVKNDLSEFGVGIESFLIPKDMDPNFSHLKILSILQEGNYQGAAIAPVNIYHFNEITNYLKEKQIPTVLFNEGSLEPERLFYYGPDNELSGRMAGELMAKLMGQKGTVCIFVRTPRLSLYAQRMQGFCSTLYRTYPQVILSNIYTYEHGQEQELLSSVLQQNPDLKGIYVMDGSGAGNFSSILKEKNISNLCLIGHESAPLSLDMLQEGYISALICEQKVSQGYYPVKLLYEYLVQGTLPEEQEIYSDLNIVIRENLHCLSYYEYGRGFL